MEKRQYENEFKTMIVELLQSGMTAKELSEEYNINSGIIRRWKREFKAKSGDFSKKRELSPRRVRVEIIKEGITRC